MTICSSPLDTCLTDVLDEVPDLLGRCFDVAVSSLQREGSQDHEVVVYDRASKPWWDLLLNRSAWARDYAQRLSDAFSGASGEGAVSGPVPLLPPVVASGGPLQLDSVVDEVQTSGRLLQELMPLVEQELAMLDARMSSLMGPDTAYAEANPLRPSVFVRVLHELMVSVEPDSKVRTRWLRHLVPPLGLELRGLYQRLAVRLQRAASHEAGYRVRLVDDPQAYRPPPPPSRDLLPFNLSPAIRDVAGEVLAVPGGPLLSMTAMARAQSALEPELLQTFLKQGGEPFEQTLTADYYAQVQRELAAIDRYASLPLLADRVPERSSRYQDMPLVDRPVRSVDIGSPLCRDTWGRFAASHERTRLLLELKAKALRVSQAMGLDVVRKLVNQVARDPLLLAPVREAMVALEPSLLRMAMVQPRFFSEARHPARRLVESVAQRAFNYNDEFSPEFERFLQPVQRVFQALNESGTDDPQVFADALGALRETWDSQDQRDNALRDQRLQALRFAQERQALADQISLDLSRQPELDGAPDLILDFLYGTWSLVIASAQLIHGSDDADPGGYRAVVSSLLWSVRKDVIAQSPALVSEVLPGMIQTLHRGLDMLGTTEEETQTFFEALMRLHKSVLRRTRSRAPTEEVSHSSPVPLEVLPAQDSAPMALEDTFVATAEHRTPLTSAEPWLDRSELAAAGYIEEPSSDHAALGEATAADPAGSAPSPEAAESPLLDAERVLTDLREGDWVDLHSQGEWLRAQLLWASDNRTLFMFTSTGGRTHSMSKRSCIKLIDRRWLRPVDAHSVVQSAIQSIAAAGVDPSGDPPVA